MTMEMNQWRPAPANWHISDGELHIWSFPLDQPKAHREQLWQTLAPDEKERAGRFYFDKDRFRYSVSRGVLRVLLGNYLTLRPKEVQFCYGEHGKPELAKRHERNGRLLRFNLSHSAGLGLAAFIWNRAIGVDVEQVRPLEDGANIAKHYFSAAENSVFFRLPFEKQPQAFFECWTRKEAFIKAIGEGLTYPLRNFDVTLGPGAEAELVSVEGSKQSAAQWRMLSLQPAPGYTAAVVAANGAWRPLYFGQSGLEPILHML